MFDVREGRRNVGMVALAISFIFLFTTALQILLVPLIAKLAPQWTNHVLFTWLMSSVPMYACAMPLSLIFFRACRTTQAPQKKKMTAWSFISIFSLCFAGTYLFNIVGTLVNNLFSALLGRAPVNAVEEMTTASPAWVNLIFVVILAPIFEELFMRKLVIDRLLPCGELPAILISGIAFGLIHGNFNQFFYATAVGMIFAVVYLRTGSIVYTIGMHMLLNFIGGVYAAEAIKLIGSGSTVGTLVGAMMNYFYMIILIGAVIISIITVKSIIEKRPHLERPDPAPTSRDWVRMLILNPFVWIFLAVTALMFLL